MTSFLATISNEVIKGRDNLTEGIGIMITALDKEAFIINEIANNKFH